MENKAVFFFVAHVTLSQNIAIICNLLDDWVLVEPVRRLGSWQLGEVGEKNRGTRWITGNPFWMSIWQPHRCEFQRFFCFFFWMLTLIPTTMKRPCFFLFRLILALLANCSSCFSPPIFCPNRTAFLNPNERFARWRFSREPSDFCLAWKRTAKIPLLFGSWKALKQKHNQ